MANLSNYTSYNGCGCNSFIGDILERAGHNLLQYRNFLKLSMGSNELLDTSNSFAATASSIAASEETPATDTPSQDNTVPDKNYPADTIYFGGSILTMVADEDRVEALAVKAGKIVAAGSETEVMKLKGYNTGMVDLKGKCLMPGFIDPHSHVTMQSAKFFTVNLDPAPIGTVQSIIQKDGERPEFSIQGQLRKYIEEKKPALGTLIIGWGYDDTYSKEKRHPCKEELDAISTDYPILLVHISNHLCACNTTLLELAKINESTEDPAGGVIRRKEGTNEPNGVLEEKAMMLVLPYLPAVSPNNAMKMLEEGLQYYAAAGITTAQDGAASLGGKTLLEEMDKAGKLPIDVVSYLLFTGVDQATLNQIPGVYSNTHNPRNRFRVGGVKLVVDGSIQGRTAFLTEPYLNSPDTPIIADKCSDQKTEQMFLSTKIDINTTANSLTEEEDNNKGYSGYPNMKQEEVTQWVRDCDSRNVQILIHTNGDAATDFMINAIKDLRKVDSLRDLRTTIIHAQTIREDQLDEVVKYNLIPSFFPIHIAFWGDRHKTLFLGDERAKRISPARSALDRGLKITLHHDAPIAGISMLAVASASVNRMTYDQENKPNEVLGEDQKITPFEALRAITADAAWQYFEEDHKGTLEVGKRADLVILSQDPLVIGKEKPLEMKDIEVVATIKDGQPIYSLEDKARVSGLARRI
ncbi:putative TIM-barrel fold metal-dependent hydrolase [Cylindrospermum stagnale PCC 7417]|uniref:Putative TIM-barrel fold metal-dependent hydrolase n=1 Tax=Cylindrospermum stagnale PCC 7417 TaxID=56107 RepID=K9X4C6_9NOST|nr:amidohydrolase [Cylindrospermum stagnale]AFZ26517.1 putative TIM-barrel fold metal-dependent hydrolase [Cylindrospermum stagnale PCC 7417]